jgi:hypothetical protein
MKKKRTSSAWRNDADGNERKRENVPTQAIIKAIPNAKVKNTSFLLVPDFFYSYLPISDD